MACDIERSGADDGADGGADDGAGSGMGAATGYISEFSIRHWAARRIENTFATFV